MPREPQDALMQRREAAKTRRLRAARAAQARAAADPAATLLARQRVEPAAVAEARAFELPSAKNTSVQLRHALQQGISSSVHIPHSRLSATH